MDSGQRLSRQTGDATTVGTQTNRREATGLVDPLPGVWSYYTCCADVSERLDYDDTLSWESDAARWFTESELSEVELFAPFANVFPTLRAIFEN